MIPVTVEVKSCYTEGIYSDWRPHWSRSAWAELSERFETVAEAAKAIREHGSPKRLYRILVDNVPVVEMHGWLRV